MTAELRERQSEISTVLGRLEFDDVVIRSTIAEAEHSRDELIAALERQSLGGKKSVTLEQVEDAHRTVARLKAAAVELDASTKIAALKREQAAIELAIVKASRQEKMQRFEAIIDEYRRAVVAGRLFPLADEIRALAIELQISITPENLPSPLISRRYLNIGPYRLA